MRINPDTLCVTVDTILSEVMKVIDRGQIGIALVVNGNRLLQGTVTDGDIRRGLLRGLTLDTPIREVMQGSPIVATENMPEAFMLELMRVNSIRHLPIVDDRGRIVALEYMDVSEVTGTAYKEPPTAVVMAGGEGKRLRPLTEGLPKPMLPVGDRPVLDILLTSLQRSGFQRILISVGYLRQAIQDYFQDGSTRGLDIHYLVEDEPLGTAGALGLIPDNLKPVQPFLVVNGDVLTRLNFAVFRDFHVATGYDFTLCCRPYEVSIPFGYPVLDGDLVIGFKEKPTFHYLVNSGIYCLSPGLLDRVAPHTFLNMTDLIEDVYRSEARVGVFPLREPFYEIGRIESYEKAEAFYRKHFYMDDGE